MHRNIFYDKLSDLSYQDVKGFLDQKIAESVYLDYKADIGDGKDIPKDVAAMANAQGGVLIIGVKTIGEDKGPGRPDETVGVPDPDRIKDIITKKCSMVLKPVLIPEMWQYQIPDTENFIVLARIPESLEGPHWFGNEHSCTVPVRTNDFTTRQTAIKFLTPLDFDSFSQRRAALERRQHSLLKRARERAAIVEQQNTYFSIGIVPHYPASPVCDLQRLNEKFAQISGDFYQSSAGMTSAHETMCIRRNHPDLTYFETTIWGSLFVIQRAEVDSNPYGLKGHPIGHILSDLGKMLRRAEKFYRANNFLGLVRIEIAVQRAALPLEFFVFLSQEYIFESSSRGNFVSPDSKFLFELDYYSSDLTGDHIAGEIVRELLFCCGLSQIAADPPSVEVMKKYLEGKFG